MISELTNHLWQSTLFAVAAGLLTVAFRKNRARQGLQDVLVIDYIEKP